MQKLVYVRNDSSLAAVSVQAQKQEGPDRPIIINHSITVQDEVTAIIWLDPNSGEYKFRRCKDDFEWPVLGW
jgi:hypothetical protein